MLNSTRTCLALAFISSLLVLSAASAQIPSGDAAFGYSRTGSNIFYPNTPGLNGWDATAFLKINKPFIGVEGDVSHYGLGANAAVPRTTTFLFGPQIALHAAGFKLFVHGLIGGEHSKNNVSNTPIDAEAFAYALGGGADIPFFPHLAWRLQLDHINAPSLSTANADKIRFTTGLVLRF